MEIKAQDRSTMPQMKITTTLFTIKAINKARTKTIQRNKLNVRKRSAKLFLKLRRRKITISTIQSNLEIQSKKTVNLKLTIINKLDLKEN